MNNRQKATKALVFWYKVFALSFMVFAIVVTIGGMKLLDEFSAYHECSAVSDSKFSSCYDQARQ